MIERVKAVIFDFDGVILESADIKTDAFVELFAAYPQHQAAIRQHHLSNLGVSRFRKFEWIYRELLNKRLSGERCEQLGREFSKIVLDKVLQCRFVPGAAELLHVLQRRCLMFVASGTPHAELETILRQRGLADFFDGAWGSPREKVDIVRHILHQFDLAAQDVLFIGDGVSDYEAAREASVAFLARATPFTRSDWEQRKVDWVADLKELVVAIRSADRVGVSDRQG